MRLCLMLHVFRSLIMICFKWMLHLVPLCYTEDNVFIYKLFIQALIRMFMQHSKGCLVLHIALKRPSPGSEEVCF